MTLSGLWLRVKLMARDQEAGTASVQRMASVRGPLLQAINIGTTILQIGVTSAIEQTGAKKGSPSLPR